MQHKPIPLGPILRGELLGLGRLAMQLPRSGGRRISDPGPTVGSQHVVVPAPLAGPSADRGGNRDSRAFGNAAASDEQPNPRTAESAREG